MGASVYKAESVLPFDSAYKALYKNHLGAWSYSTIATPLDRRKATRKITWGLGRIRTIATPLDRRKATRKITWGLGRVRTIATPENYLGAKESVAKEQLKHRHPLSTAHKVTWGLFVSNTKEFERTLVTGYRPTAWKPGVFT